MLQKKIMYVFVMGCGFLGGCKQQQKKKQNTPIVISSEAKNNKRMFIMPSQALVVSHKKNKNKKRGLSSSASICRKNINIGVFSLTPQECEARMMDIPVPIHAQLVSGDSDQKGGTCVMYTTTAALDTVICFYKQEMERMGWQKLYTFESAHYSLFHFSRPDGVCYVIVSEQGLRSWWSKKITSIHVITG